MSAECADNAQLYVGGRPVRSVRYNVATDFIGDKLWDGGTTWVGGPGATECVATCTKGNVNLVAPGDMVCMSPNAVRVMRGGDGSSQQLGVLSEGSYRGNALGDTQAFNLWSVSASGVATPTVTANVAKDTFGATTAERIVIPATTGAQFSRIFSFHGCQNAGGYSVASIYYANFDGGLSDGGSGECRPDLKWKRTAAGEMVSVQCPPPTGAGDGGLLYQRCFTPAAEASEVNGDFSFGNWSADGGARNACDLAVFAAQCEAEALFPGSYIPNSARNDQSGLAYPTTTRGNDVIGIFFPMTVAPQAVSMSVDFLAPASASATSQVYTSVSNGTIDHYFQLQSGFNNNTRDDSISSNVHSNITARVGMLPQHILWNQWNTGRLAYANDAGYLSVQLNGAADSGYFAAGAGAFRDFVPTGPGYYGMVGTGAFWNLCGNYDGTHSAFGVCKNVCLNLMSANGCPADGGSIEGGGTPVTP